MDEPQIVKDAGLECSKDTSAAVGRNVSRLPEPEAKVMIALYGVVGAVGAFNGVVAAVLEHSPVITPAVLDALWEDMIRPAVLGEFGK